MRPSGSSEKFSMFTTPMSRYAMTKRIITLIFFLSKVPIFVFKLWMDHRKKFLYDRRTYKSVDDGSLYQPFNAQEDTCRCPLSPKFQFFFKKGSSKKIPMSVAHMSW